MTIERTAGPAGDLIPERFRSPFPVSAQELREGRPVVLDRPAEHDLADLPSDVRKRLDEALDDVEDGTARLEPKQRELTGVFSVRLTSKWRALFYMGRERFWHLFSISDHDYGEVERRWVASKARMSTTAYQMSHRPDDDGPPLHDLLQGEMMPDDVYEHPEYYGPPGRASAELGEIIRQYRGKPDAMVTIFRAQPEIGGDTIRKGDWVALRKPYAAQHAKHPTDPAKDMPVLTARVPAKDVLFALDYLEEWGYWGSEIRATRMASLNVTPPSSAANLVDRSRSDAIGLREGSARLGGLADSPDVGLSEPGIPPGFPWATSTLSDHVGTVAGMGSESQMAGLTAGRVVAGSVHDQGSLPVDGPRGSNPEIPGKGVGHHRLSVDGQLPVSSPGLGSGEDQTPRLVVSDQVRVQSFFGGSEDGRSSRHEVDGTYFGPDIRDQKMGSKTGASSGTYYRIHHKRSPWTLTPVSQEFRQNGYDEVRRRVGDAQPGYSCFSNPWHVLDYVVRRRWQYEGSVVHEFRGTEVGRGIDGEPLVIPTGQPTETWEWDEFVAYAMERPMGSDPSWKGSGSVRWGDVDTYIDTTLKTYDAPGWGKVRKVKEAYLGRTPEYSERMPSVWYLKERNAYGKSIQGGFKTEYEARSYAEEHGYTIVFAEHEIPTRIASKTAAARPATLYHYTSTAHFESIKRDGRIRTTESNIEITGAGPRVVWLTSTDTQDGNGLYGKGQVRLEIKTPRETAHWPTWSFEQGIAPYWYAALESASNGNPETWWVCPREISLDEVVSVEVMGRPSSLKWLDFTGSTKTAVGTGDDLGDFIVRGLSWHIDDYDMAVKIRDGRVTAREIISGLEPLGVWWGLPLQYSGGPNDLSEFEYHADGSGDPDLSPAGAIKDAQRAHDYWMSEKPFDEGWPEDYVKARRSETLKAEFSGCDLPVVLIAERPRVKTLAGDQYWDPSRHNESNGLMGNSYLPSGFRLKIRDVRIDPTGRGQWKSLGGGITSTASREVQAEDLRCFCCKGIGEHHDGHECYVCDSSGSAIEAGGEICEGHHGTPDDGPENAKVRYGDDFEHYGSKTAMPVGPLPEGMKWSHGQMRQFPGVPAQHMVKAKIDGKMIGHIRWLTKDYKRPPGKAGEIVYVFVDSEYQRRGVATWMLERARAVDPRVHHSSTLTEDGAAWSQKVALPSWRDRGRHPEAEAIIAPDTGRARNNSFMVYLYGEPHARRSSLKEAKETVEEIYGSLDWLRVPGDQMPHQDLTHGDTVMFNDAPYFIIARIPTVEQRIQNMAAQVLGEGRERASGSVLALAELQHQGRVSPYAGAGQEEQGIGHQGRLQDGGWPIGGSRGGQAHLRYTSLLQSEALGERHSAAEHRGHERAREAQKSSPPRVGKSTFGSHGGPGQRDSGSQSRGRSSEATRPGVWSEHEDDLAHRETRDVDSYLAERLPRLGVSAASSVGSKSLTVYRGLYVGLEEDDYADIPRALTRKAAEGGKDHTYGTSRSGAGVHWTLDRRVAEQFATPMTMHGDTPNLGSDGWGVFVPVILTAQVSEDDAVTSEEELRDAMVEGVGWTGLPSSTRLPEKEVLLRKGAPVRISSVEALAPDSWAEVALAWEEMDAGRVSEMKASWKKITGGISAKAKAADPVHALGPEDVPLSGRMTS